MVNRVFLLGRLGKDPETRSTPGGQMVAGFSLATTESRADKKHTEWHNIVAWGKLAEMCERYLKKGRMVFIEGKIQARSWEKDGKHFSKTEIVAQSLQFVDSPNDKPGERRSSTAPQEDFEAIPF